MINMQSIIVPQISTYPAPEMRARKVLAWLVSQNVVAEQLSTCARSGSRMGYAIAEGAPRSKMRDIAKRERRERREQHTRTNLQTINVHTDRTVRARLAETLHFGTP